MNTELLNKVEKPFLKKTTKFNVGDTIAVSNIIREGNKKRTQIFKGIVIAIKGSGIRKTFTIRKISYGIGVEKIFPLFSPNIEKIKILKKGKVRRAKLYYMRKRIGKRAMKISEGKDRGEQYEGYDELEVPEEGEAEKSEEITKKPIDITEKTTK